MTTEPVIFACAKPQSIQITERYRYITIISRNSEIKPQGDPTGEVELVIPYRGDICFTKDAINDIEHQQPGIWNASSSLNARIGYVGFSNYQATNIEQKASLRSHDGVLPIEVPIRGAPLNSKSSLVSTQQKCVITQQYTPNLPSTIPININAEILDEDFFEEYRLLHAPDLKDLEKNIPDRTDFERRLFFNISVRLLLPTKIEDGLPKLTRFAIEWPVTISDRLMALQLVSDLFQQSTNGNNAKSGEVIYNPVDRVIQWGNVDFLEPRAISEVRNLYEYTTPPMILSVERPGELYHKESLQGSVEIEIPQLLSGLRVDYFGADGHRITSNYIISDLYSLKVQQKTLLSSELTFDLAYCFNHKAYVPYQHLQFEGVILNDMRIQDIRTLLKNSDFQVEPTVELEDSQKYILLAKQQKELATLSLWILIEGSRSRTTRQRELTGGQTYTTQLETGQTVIYMKGLLKGNSKPLITVMNEVQKKLKEQFRHVATID